MWVLMSFMVGVLVALSVWAVLRGLMATAVVDAAEERMGRFAERKILTIDEAELRLPFSERVLKPAFKKLVSTTGRLAPQGNVQRLRHDLIAAGNPYDLAAIDFLGIKVFAAFVVAVLAFVLTMMRDSTVPIALAAALVGLVVGFNLPSFWLRSKISKRRGEIVKTLPDALDMLTICVDAGLAFESAMMKIAEKWNNALSQEFDRAVAEMRMGMSRRDALHNIALRTDVSDVASFVAVLVQADQLGVSIAQILHVQSEQMRVLRRLRAEEQARQAPIKMTFPLVFFIFPALFAVLLGPAVPALMETFGSFR
jgi:tight adherence protein C